MSLVRSEHKRMKQIVLESKLGSKTSTKNSPNTNASIGMSTYTRERGSSIMNGIDGILNFVGSFTNQSEHENTPNTQTNTTHNNNNNTNANNSTNTSNFIKKSSGPGSPHSSVSSLSYSLSQQNQQQSNQLFKHKHSFQMKTMAQIAVL